MFTRACWASLLCQCSVLLDMGNHCSHSRDLDLEKTPRAEAASPPPREASLAVRGLLQELTSIRHFLEKREGAERWPGLAGCGLRAGPAALPHLPAGGAGFIASPWSHSGPFGSIPEWVQPTPQATGEWGVMALVRVRMGEFQSRGAPVMFSKHIYSSCLFPVPMHLSSPKPGPSLSPKLGV